MISRELSGEAPGGGKERGARHPSARFPDRHREELDSEVKMRQAFTAGSPGRHRRQRGGSGKERSADTMSLGKDVSPSLAPAHPPAG